MIHAGIGLSCDTDTERALLSATETALSALTDEPAFAVVAATLDHFDDVPRLELLLRQAFGKLPVAGTSSEAISLLDPRSSEAHPQVHRESALAVLLVGGTVKAASFCFEDGPAVEDAPGGEDATAVAKATPPGESSDEGPSESHDSTSSAESARQALGSLEGRPISSRIGEAAVRAAVESLGAPISSFLFFADPLSSSIPLLGAITARTAPEAMAAGGGSTGGGGQLFQIGGGRVISGGCAGLAVARHWNRVAISVSQGGQLVGMQGTITRMEPGRILEIDGKPATVLLDSLTEEDLSVPPDQVASLLALAVAPAGQDALKQHHYMVRELNGVDPVRRVLGVNAHLEEGWGVGLLLREGIAAKAEVARNAKHMLEAFGGTVPGFGVYFDCNTRGEKLYAVDGVDLARVRKGIGDFPVLGVSSSFEIGPLWLGGGMTPTALHRHTGVLWAMGTDPDSPLGRGEIPR